MSDGVGNIFRATYFKLFSDSFFQFCTSAFPQFGLGLCVLAEAFHIEGLHSELYPPKQ
jgi:hypothetical protein